MCAIKVDNLSCKVFYSTNSCIIITVRYNDMRNFMTLAKRNTITRQYNNQPLYTNNKYVNHHHIKMKSN